MKHQPLINYLNELLSNHFVLYVKLHRYHWYVQGPQFFQLHAQFEEMYEQTASDLDRIAERILMINGQPYATMSKFVKEATIAEATADDTVDEMMNQLRDDFNHMIASIRDEGLRLADESQDEPTKDLLIGLTSQFEKYNWMIDAYQTKR